MKNEYVMFSPRTHGKMTQAMMGFIIECRKNKRAIFRMKEGNLYSPVALKALISEVLNDYKMKGKNNPLIKAIEEDLMESIVKPWI